MTEPLNYHMFTSFYLCKSYGFSVSSAEDEFNICINFLDKECLKDRLQQRGYQKEEVDGQLRLVRRFLSEKICDIKRKVSINLEVRFVSCYIRSF